MTDLLEHIRETFRRITHKRADTLKQFHCGPLKWAEHGKRLGAGHNVLKLFRCIQRVEDFNGRLFGSLERNGVKQPELL